MSVLDCIEKAWEVFWEAREKEKKRIVIWKCDNCGRVIKFNPDQMWIGGRGPRQGWFVVECYRPNIQIMLEGKKNYYKFCCEDCMKNFNF